MKRTRVVLEGIASSFSPSLLLTKHFCQGYKYFQLILEKKMSKDEISLARFNEILGTASTNVPAYSNTDDETFSIGRHYLHGIFMGVKWQCVEYARRWLLIRKGCVFQNIRCAADIWTDMTFVERVTDGEKFPLISHSNGSPIFPKKDTFLIYCRSEEQPVGHIAVICDVGENSIRIAEQNNKFHYWNSEYARELPVVCKDGLYFIIDEDPLYGWMEIDDQNQLKTLEDLGTHSIHSQYVQIPPPGKFQRSTIQRKPQSIDQSWLNKDDPVENYFIQIYGEDPQNIYQYPTELPFYKINFDFLLNVGEVSLKLHELFLEATNLVINDDQLLTQFGIPQIFWERIRHSWNNEQDFNLTGRFDFGFDGEKLKVFEYNADTANQLFECAIIQKKWPEAVHLPSVFTPVRRLNLALVQNWKKMKINSKIHLFIDENPKERLTALYMQNVIKEAGLQSKLCVGMNEFVWKDGFIVDQDGDKVQFVWKSLMWETIFEDYLHSNAKSEHPRLSDVFLNDQIKVIEPIWKVITSNKGILSLLSQIYPNHLNLLLTEWNLSDQFKENGYVQKPIVGRHGENITLYQSNGDSIIATRPGQYSHRPTIYQQLFPLKNTDGYYPIVNSWMIGGLYAGLCVREDENLITNDQSPMVPCCIVWEEEK